MKCVRWSNAVERLLEPELHRRAGDQELQPEVLRRIECDGAPVAVRRRQRVGRVVAAQPAELEAVPLEKVAALDPLALAVRRSPSRQASACSSVSALTSSVTAAFLCRACVLARGVGSSSPAGALLAARSRPSSSCPARLVLVLGSGRSARLCPRSRTGCPAAYRRGRRDDRGALVSPKARARTTVVARGKARKS